MRIAPGGPFDYARPLPVEVQQRLMHIYKLDGSLLEQYGRFLWQLCQGELGTSLYYRDFQVTDLIAQTAPVSAFLGIVVLMLAIIGGIALGLFMAQRAHTPTDTILLTFTSILTAVPAFVMGPLLIMIFAIQLQWLPVAVHAYTSWDAYILPVIVLCLPVLAQITQLCRAGLLEAFEKPYFRTALSKGLPLSYAIYHHALRPALMPVLSFLGPTAANLLTGTVVVEQIFGIPGLGRYFVHAALNRDYTLVMGLVIVYGVTIIFLNTLVDILYGVCDARVRHQS
jgi:oligopeptide transport system permease protein